MDQGALRAARDLGLAIGGWAPPDLRSEAGPIDPRFGLRPTPEDRSPGAPDVPRSPRTEGNARDPDACLVLHLGATPPADRGTRFAVVTARRLGRPQLVLPVDSPNAVSRVRAFLVRVRPAVLGVGGPAESRAPGIEALTYRLLRAALSEPGGADP